MSSPVEPADQHLFNPLAIESLAESILRRLMEQDPAPLGELEPMVGQGIYAIYYTGNYPLYEVISRHNMGGQWRLPIYVGKAVAPGGRKGIATSNPLQGTSLFSRLKDHATSIRDAENLDIEDFFTRWLLLDDIWIALGESALIRAHRPLWNSHVSGFGNHDPGRGRSGGVRPEWDTIHPGRSWAVLLPARKDGPSVIEATAAQYLDLMR